MKVSSLEFIQDWQLYLVFYHAESPILLIRKLGTFKLSFNKDPFSPSQYFNPSITLEGKKIEA